MPIATGLAIGLGAAVAAGSIGSAAIGAHAAGKAANTQAQAAENAQQVLAQNQERARNYQEQILAQNQGFQQPYYQAGKQTLNSLADLVNNPETSIYGKQFAAPTLEQARATPGYQFQLQTGIDALDKSAAARGNLFSGTQGTALEQYGQGLADTSYNNLYNQALQTYMTNYNVWHQGTSDQINRLGQVAGMGQQAANTLGQQGQQAASNITAIDVGGAENLAQQINNAAAARASGYVGAGNSWSNAAAQISQLPVDIYAATRGGPVRPSSGGYPVDYDNLILG
jgi:hypothetical protein